MLYEIHISQAALNNQQEKNEEKVFREGELVKASIQETCL